MSCFLLHISSEVSLLSSTCAQSDHSVRRYLTALYIGWKIMKTGTRRQNVIFPCIIRYKRFPGTSEQEFSIYQQILLKSVKKLSSCPCPWSCNDRVQLGMVGLNGIMNMKECTDIPFPKTAYCIASLSVCIFTNWQYWKQQKQADPVGLSKSFVLVLDWTESKFWDC